MTRRLTIFVAAVFGVALAAETASALTASTARCVRNARSTFSGCQQDAREQCRTDFNTNLLTCFGNPNDEETVCPRQCQLTLLGCQDGPLKAQAACRDDKVANTGDCRDVFEAARDKCRADFPGQDAAQSEARKSCLAQAALARFACNQNCSFGFRDELAACNTDFNDCLESCANPR